MNLTDAMHFIYELGTEPAEPLILDMPVVAELLRVSDALFMPSHREGFGMPILEAGLVGIPVFSSTAVPSAQEIAAQNISLFTPNAEPSEIAQLILQRLEADPVYRLKRHTRQKLGWQAIFQNEILPLVHGEIV